MNVPSHTTITCTSCLEVMQCVLPMLSPIAAPPTAHHTHPSYNLCHLAHFDPSRLSQPSSHWCTSLEAITATTNAFSKTQHLVLGMPPLTYFEPCRCKVPPHMPMLCPLIASVNQGLKCRKISAIFLCEISLISRLRHNIRHWLSVNGNFGNFPKITPRYLSVFLPIFWEISRYFLPVQPAHRIQNLSNFLFFLKKKKKKT